MEEIGRRLRSEREAKGITLEQAEEETKIRRKYLEALETAREADIPGEVYLKGFLRTYGNYVGLDGPELVEEYKYAKRKRERQRESAAARAEQGPERAAAGEGSAIPVMPGAAEADTRHAEAVTSGSAGAVTSRPAGAVTARPRPAGARERPRRPVERAAAGAGILGALRSVGLAVAVVALLGAIGYLGWLIFRQTGPGTKPQPTPPAPPPAATNQPKPPDPAPKLPDPPKVTMARGTGEDVIFTVPAKEIQVKLEPGAEPVWVEAVVDGKMAYSATGTKPVAVTGTKIQIRAGHMNGISVTVNGQRFETPLQKGPYNLIFNGQ